MPENFDVVVIGAGPAGEVCAGELADAGRKVAIVERELVAGECSFWACMPSKAMLRPSEALANAARFPGAGSVEANHVDPSAVFKWRDRVVNDWNDDNQVPWLDKKGIELVRGAGRLAGSGVVEVGDRKLAARDIVLATGSATNVPPIDGLDSIEYWTNRDATSTSEPPDHLIILGGGAVGTELAQAFARLGGGVSVIEAERHILASEDPKVAEVMTAALAADGVEIIAGARAEEVRSDGDGVIVRLDDGRELSGSKLLVATGRKAQIDALGLESVDVEPAEGAVPVDRRLAAGPGLWAIGDVNGIDMTTHAGKYQARIAARNILGGDVEADYSAIPRIVFSDPQVAGVGMTLAQADEQGVQTIDATASLGRLPAAKIERGDRTELDNHFLKLITDARRMVLIGAVAVGPRAADWVGQATLAIRAEVPIATLAETIQPFPTLSEAYASAARMLIDRHKKAGSEIADPA